MHRGYTLVELAFVLLLISVSGLAVLPAARSLHDRMAVVGAREAVVGLFAEARVDALLLGGATVRVRPGPWRVWSEAGDSVLRTVHLERDFAVTVWLGRSRTESDLRYDALGIGQVASATLTFRRGAAESALVVSGYGRVRRR